MNRRIIFLLLLLVVAGVVVALVVLNSGGGQGGTQQQTTQQQQPQPQQPITQATPLPTITPVPMVEIVVAIQDIPRGTIIRPDTVQIYPWPADAVPVNAISNPEDVINKVARTDIFREQPILGNLIVDDFQNLATIGSDAALITPPNRVLISVPMNRLTSVAFALQPGDRVDIIASFLFVDVDQTFQSAEPNQFNLISVAQEGGDPATGQGGSVAVTFGQSSLRGAFDTRLIPTVGSWPVLVLPSENPRPRLSVQRTITDAQVIWLGDFPTDGRLFRPAASPTPLNPTPTPEGQAQQAQVPPTEVPPLDIVTVAVSPQDAVVLAWYIEARIPFTFVLRSAVATALPQTDPVTLDYIMSRFNILVPEKFNYSIEPAIRSIRRLEVGSEISINQ